MEVYATLAHADCTKAFCVRLFEALQLLHTLQCRCCINKHIVHGFTYFVMLRKQMLLVPEIGRVRILRWG